MNFTCSYSQLISTGAAAFYQRLPNGEVIGLIRDAMDYKIDITFGKIIPSHSSIFLLRYSQCYSSSSLSWFVPDPNIAPRWQIIFKVFPLKLWVLLGIFFVMVCLLYWVLEHFNTTGSTPTLNFDFNFSKIPFADLFSIGLGASSTLNPQPVYLRLLFAFWAIYSLHWYMAYTSVLFALMTNPPLEKEISNINDLKDSGLKTSGNRVLFQFFDHLDLDKTTRAVLDNRVGCHGLDGCLQGLVKFRNVSLMGIQDDIESTLNMRIYKIHKLKEDMMIYHVSLVTTRGNPLENGLNKLLLLTMQLGFLNKWVSDVQLVNHNKNFEVVLEEKKLPLNFGHLQGAFSILMCGLIIAFLCFVGEIFMYRKSSSRKTKSNTNSMIK
ncbi:uncharacterized protein LOC124358623 [Homalodisca vitripennis]|uniref:uncharacterized protein LOC124358623 n=1 Tax=Homalodisca vitripennis TaxID=197043 RepID=UPI001EEA809B|nr:uncharacterized protein LOC124358623 [Homalodisca vitripennis]